MDINNAITKIIQELKQPLPGEEYQFLMAPSLRRLPASGLEAREAAVLICLLRGEEDITVVLIKRAEYNGPHSGQVSFPGGISEPFDFGLEDTALRETEEETGLHRENMHLLGRLTSLHIPVSNITVHPFVAFYSADPVFEIDQEEVSYIILTGLKFFLDRVNLLKEPRELAGSKVLVPFYKLEEEKIWGATAMIISEFMEVVRRAGVY